MVGGDRVVNRDGGKVEIEGRIGEGVCQDKRRSRTVSGSDQVLKGRQEGSERLVGQQVSKSLGQQDTVAG